ncbi:DUF4192 family protein [Tersicoccus sp. Bi-70]|uniref:DUF4192 family protein n=1 Tax=Tersicoccus sp. Bi-70 TaxID=1897634 RepID=UPI000977CB77|nr:DUF4192 family protein [Tersicoccus sp. Bi-70]OMH34806.1 hypothetical protein BGP79_00010 [Tersicoccus sp. Bi-70]
MTKRITVRTHADLLALMELTSGRRPSDSLLVQGMTRQGTELGPSLRLDLPQHIEDENTIRAFALYVVDTITTGGPLDRLMIALYSEHVNQYGTLTDAVTEAANAEGIDLFRLFHCTPAAWRTVVPELEVWAMWSEVTHSTAGIAARAEHGLTERPTVTAPAYTGSALQGAKIDRAARAFTVTATDGRHHADTLAARRQITALTGAETVEVSDAATVAAMVGHRPLRDWIMFDAYGLGGDLTAGWPLLASGRVVPDWERVDEVERVIWTVLAMTPPSHRADLFAVLAMFAWTKGMGTDADTWADLAEQADPGHVLAGLIRQGITLGVHPLATNRRTAYRRH